MSDWKNVQYKDGKLRTNNGGGGGSSTFAGLDDVNFSNLTDGQIPKYDSATQKWVNANESGGGGTVTDVEVDGTSVVNQNGVAEIPAIPENLSDLGDVQISNPALNNILMYSNSKWRNESGFPYVPEIYSTEEREIGVWTDGKPLYQKTWIFTAPSSQVYATLSLGISDIDTIFIKNGKVTKSGFTVGLQGYSDSLPSELEFIGFLSTNNTRFDYRVGDLLFSGDCELTLCYTKTTDTAGSGKWTTSGVPAHHYSTNEQVVGTWIDGKPLYERTFVKNNVSATTSDTLLITASEIDPNSTVDIKFIMGRFGTMQANTRPYNNNGYNDLWGSSLVYYHYHWWSETSNNAVITLQYTKSTD